MTSEIRGASETVAVWRESKPLELSPILTSALDAFYEQGYHATSVRDIARRVGVTVPALYYHHENKEAILFSLLDASIEYLHRLCKAALADAADEPDIRFLNLVECIALYMANSTKIASLDGEIRSLSPELRKVYGAKRYEIESMLLLAIADGKDARLFDVTVPRDTARALLGMFQAISTWYQQEGELAPANIAVRYTDIAAHSVGAAPGVIARIPRYA